jgi:hypothetical protein
MTIWRRTAVSSTPRAGAGVVIALVTLACGSLTACGGSSQHAKAAAGTSPSARAFVAGQGCMGAEKAAGRLVGANGKAPKSMTGAGPETMRGGCVDVPASTKGGPSLGADARTGPSAMELVAEFATCMRQHGVNVPAPTPVRSDPQLNTRGIDTRSSRVRAASGKCGHFLRVSGPAG